jgi:hypothetical protein
MITETQTCVIILQLTGEQLVQLQPYMDGLDITATAHNLESCMQCLTMDGASTLCLWSAWAARRTTTSVGNRANTSRRDSLSACAHLN